MSKLAAHICLFLIAAMTLFSCEKQQQRMLQSALDIYAIEPDSALHLLNTIEESLLDTRDRATFALVYTMALDKSGQDVNNDSLIRQAYNHFIHQEDDTLYARCLYYMGKYYSLVDSLEMAKSCLEKAIKTASNQGDNETVCLASERLSRVVVNTDLPYASQLASDAVRIYEQQHGASKANRVYYRLNEALCTYYSGQYVKAIKQAKYALSLSRAMGDSSLISSVCQDMSCMYKDMGLNDSALVYAKSAFSLYPNETCALALAQAYIGVDSLGDAKKTLQKINPQLSSTMQYFVNYLKQQIAIREGNADRAMLYADSSFVAIEEMYAHELKAKDEYYGHIVESEQAKFRAEKKASARTMLTILISVLFLTIILFVTYGWYNYKRNTAQKVAMQQSTANMMLEHERELHIQDMAHKDVQISMTRNFLKQKIEIVRRLNSLEGAVEKHLFLTEADWQEITMYLDGADNMFVTRIKQQFPSLREKDIQLLMLIRLRVSTRNLASLYGISEKSIRQNLFLFKSKVGIVENSVSLKTFIENF